MSLLIAASAWSLFSLLIVIQGWNLVKLLVSWSIFRNVRLFAIEEINVKGSRELSLLPKCVSMFWRKIECLIAITNLHEIFPERNCTSFQPLCNVIVLFLFLCPNLKTFSFLTLCLTLALGNQIISMNCFWS